MLRIQHAVSARGLPGAASVRAWARAALDHDAEVTLRFVGSAESARLNAAYRGKPSPTNVLTFVYDRSYQGAHAGVSGRPMVRPAMSGDLVLCAPVLRREAREQGKTLRNHCAHLVVHGMLHLQGLDHEDDREARRMEARETAILAMFGIPDPYQEP